MCTGGIGVVMQPCLCLYVHLNRVCECLTHACLQDALQHRLPVAGPAEGRAGGREEEVQSQ